LSALFSTFSTETVVENSIFRKNFKTLLTFGKNAVFLPLIGGRRTRPLEGEPIVFGKPFAKNTIYKRNERI
jgi:hypothetical protein